MKIPFNIPFTTIESSANVKNLINNPELLITKYYSNKCADYFENKYPGYKALMTTSCTKALEVIAISLDLQPGDEVIMPSFTFVGVANAFANHSAKLVFADIEPGTMNITAENIEKVLSTKTKAVVVMHYGGVGCDMDKIIKLCKEKGIILIEDNAQGINCTHNNQLLGSFGDFSCISFDSMKNISCSEGGMLLYKEKYHENVISIYNVGTNRDDFDRGKVKEYEWVSKGSKFAMSEYNAAVLFALLEISDSITIRRREIWNNLYQEISANPKIKHLINDLDFTKEHKGHIFYIKCADEKVRASLINFLMDKGIYSVFHYSPLHTSKMYQSICSEEIHLKNTEEESKRLLRLPMNNHISNDDIQVIVKALSEFYS